MNPSKLATSRKLILVLAGMISFFIVPSNGQICSSSTNICNNNNNWDIRDPTTCGGYTNCNAGDVDLVDIRIVDPNQNGTCVSCTQGQLVTWDLEADLFFGQNGGRSCFSIAGDLYINGQMCCVFSRTNSDSCVNQSQNSTKTIPFGTITFTCGDELELRNVLVGWAANCNFTCADDMQYCPVSSKCSSPGDILIKTPVGAACYAVPASCIGQNGQVGVTARGGTPPYSYDWRDASNMQVGILAEITVAPGTYNVTVTDGEGCTSTCSVTLTTVADTEDPVITCPNSISVNNDPGQCGATVSFMATASDNCPGVMITYSHQPGSFFPIGTTMVTATATDAANRTASCMFAVQVTDNEVTPQCRNITIQLNSSGNASIVAADVDNGSSDNCAIASMSVFPQNFTCANLGQNQVTLTVMDVNGNSANCNATVTVVDNLPPTAMCVSNLIVPLNASGTASITASQIDNGSIDNCGSPTLSIFPSSFTCANVGTPVQVTLTATDGSNNQSTCNTLVTVTDPIPPMVVTRNITVQLDANGMVSINANQINNGSSDNCGIANISVAPTTFNCSNVGANTVTLTVTDVNNNSATGTATVTVQDNIAPVAACRNITVQLGANGLASITANDVNNGSSDNCGIANLAIVPSSFTCANVGNNSVVLTVTDVNGNTDMCTAIVTVEDNLAPSINCPANIVVNNDPANCGAIVTYAATASDNCSATIVYNPPSGTFFNIGTTTTVTATATDPSNNSMQCTFTVTVNDALAPGINCPPAITINCEESSNPTNTGAATSSDICGGNAGNITYNDVITPGACPNEMVITRTWTATDPNNNSTSCNQIITIVDNTPPTIACPAQLNVSCLDDVPAPNPNSLTTSDNCPGTITVTHLGDVSTGTTPVIITRTYQAEDACMNTSTCTQTIIVQNLTAPTLTCPAPVTVQCIADLPPPNINDVIAQANCGGAVTVSHVGDVSSGTCPTIVVRTYQGIDEDNNMVTCSQILTVYDDTPPVVSGCPTDIDFGCFTTGEPGISDLPAALTTAAQLGATDNCTAPSSLIVTYVDNGPIIDGCLRTFERTYSVTDECGNVTSCDPQLFTFIFDVTPPVFYDTPEDQIYACGASVPAVPSAPKVADECPGTVSMTFAETLTNQSCAGEAYHRVWTATDACGNVSTYTQIASKQDLTPPEIIRPADTTIYCGQAIPPAEYEIIEDCAESRYTEEFNEEIIPGICACSYTIRRTWYVYNSCFAEFRDTQYVYVVDTSGPTISIVNPELAGMKNGGTMIMYGCIEPGVLMSDIIVDDCCEVQDVQLYDSLIAYKSCDAFEYFALWKCGYVATDPCGNTTEFSFYVQQVDTTAPQFILVDSSFSGRIDLTCGDSTIEVPEVLISDNCDLIPTIEYYSDTVGFYPDSFAIIRSWDATDACLNADLLTQTITYCGFEPDSFVGEIGNLVWLDANENGVQDLDESGLNGIEIELFRDQNDDGFPDLEMVQKSSSKTRKGKKGTYFFTNLEPGQYYLKVNPPKEWALTSKEMGDDYHMDSDIDPATGFSQMLEVNQGQENLDIDIGIILNHALIGTEISSFTADNRGCEAQLQWVTNSSPSGHHFEVQRSRDNVNYTAIGTVETLGSSTNFSFTDKNPFAKGYYRLSYKGIDGEINYSQSEYLTIRCIDKTNFTLFPNPTKGAFSISYQGDSEGPLQAQILDVYGRIIKEWRPGKKYQGEIDPIELDQSPGLYWIRISDADSQSFKSILILDK